MLAFCTTVGLLALSGCGHSNPYHDPGRAHHRLDGFQNLHQPFVNKGFGELLRWRWDAWLNDLPPPPERATPRVTPDVAFIQRNGRAGAAMEPAVTWIGHATALVQANGLNVLTDPIWSERAFAVQFIGPKRAQPPGVAMADLPHIDVVLISHNHYDHLDEASVRALAAQAGGSPLFIVPLGLKPWLKEVGIDHAVELDWWDMHTVSGVDILLTPVQHWSARSLTDRRETLWGGFAVLGPQLNWYFPGDTGYSPDFRETRRRLAHRLGADSAGAEGGEVSGEVGRGGNGGPGADRPGFDLALLPVGAYAPRWFMRTQHVNPTEAVRMHQDLGARRSIGVHWGTFSLTDEALDQPPRDLAEAREAAGVTVEQFDVMAIGETRRLPARPPH